MYYERLWTDVINVWNLMRNKTKERLMTFFVDLKSQNNNKFFFLIKSLMKTGFVSEYAKWNAEYFNA